MGVRTLSLPEQAFQTEIAIGIVRSILPGGAGVIVQRFSAQQEGRVGVDREDYLIIQFHIAAQRVSLGHPSHAAHGGNRPVRQIAPVILEKVFDIVYEILKPAGGPLLVFGGGQPETACQDDREKQEGEGLGANPVVCTELTARQTENQRGTEQEKRGPEILFIAEALKQKQA